MTTALISKLDIWRMRMSYQGIILGLICALVTMLLLLGKTLTLQPINDRLRQDRLLALTEVLPQSYFDNHPLDEVIHLNDVALSENPVEVFIARKEGAISAVVYQVETQGYGGPITLMIALNTQGEILGLRTLSHKETPGLADKIEITKSNWITVFNGLSLANTPKQNWAVKKDGGRFDQFTGATITPRAIVHGVYKGLEFYARHAQELIELGSDIKGVERHE